MINLGCGNYQDKKRLSNLIHRMLSVYAHCILEGGAKKHATHQMDKSYVKKIG